MHKNNNHDRIDFTANEKLVSLHLSGVNNSAATNN